MKLKHTFRTSDEASRAAAAAAVCRRLILLRAAK